MRSGTGTAIAGLIAAVWLFGGAAIAAALKSIVDKVIQSPGSGG